MAGWTLLYEQWEAWLQSDGFLDVRSSDRWGGENNRPLGRGSKGMKRKGPFSLHTYAAVAHLGWASFAEIDDNHLSPRGYCFMAVFQNRQINM